MSNYYDEILSRLLSGGGYGPNQQASARTDASSAEDQMLRGIMGSKSKRRKGDRRPAGAYSLADHEFLGSAIDWARTGNTPGGSAHIGLWLKELGDPSLRDANSKRRREWAAYQQRLLGGR